MYCLGTHVYNKITTHLINLPVFTDCNVNTMQANIFMVISYKNAWHTVGTQYMLNERGLKDKIRSWLPLW